MGPKQLTLLPDSAVDGATPGLWREGKPSAHLAGGLWQLCSVSRGCSQALVPRRPVGLSPIQHFHSEQSGHCPRLSPQEGPIT